MQDNDGIFSYNEYKQQYNLTIKKHKNEGECMTNLRHRKKFSMSVQITFVILLILIPLNIAILLMTRHMVQNVWTELGTSYRHELSLYGTRFDDEMSNIHQSIQNLMGENWADLNSTSKTYELSRYNVWSQLKKTRKEHTYADAAYLKTNWNDNIVLTHDNVLIDIDEKDAIQNYLSQATMENYHILEYEAIEIDGRRYILEQVCYNDYAFGFLTKMDHILNGFREMQSYEDERYYLVDKNGNIVSDNVDFTINETVLEKSRNDVNVRQEIEDFGQRKSYQIYTYTCRSMDYYIVRMVSTDAMRLALPQITRFLQVICLGSFLLIPLMYILFRRMVIKPMGVLNLGMQEIEQENLAYRITDDAPSAEFEHMNMVFNEMVEQISTLKIEGYEKDIEKLKMETQNLRLQINPHLLLNSLNMIYSLALSKRTDVITEYTVSLMEYFRYSLRRNDELVPLDDEMDFVVNYLKIQQIRFPDAFTSVYEVDDEVRKAYIPPLLIQNFVENCMKYALKMGKTIEIMIVIKKQEDNLTISIVDTGNGMKSEILEKLRNNEEIVDRNGKHIGISNCRKRLKVFFDDKAQISISSAEESGTQIWIQMPLLYEPVKSDDKTI